MRKTITIVLQLLIAHGAWCQADNTKMFRDNPSHFAEAASGNSLVFDTRAWKFEAGSPVRSTPLVVGNAIYFGTTGGYFFALDKKTGAVKWKRSIGFPINSSAAHANGKIFFSDNQQKVYALNASDGQGSWSMTMGSKLDYPWRFDYYYSSPVLYNGKLIIGSDDGYLYVMEQTNGKLVWKFNAGSVIRATPAIYADHILFGDVDGRFHSLNLKDGKEEWTFRAVGDTLRNEDWGFDRKAILSSATIYRDKVFFGCRAGFLYCLNARDGSLAWRMNHNISWVISTPAVKESLVVTGTSDGRFVQAINAESGKEIWKFKTPQVVWSSPIIVDEVVYAADFDGQLYCLDLNTGKRISGFWAEDKIMSSPVYDDQLLYVGSDDGNLYALKGRATNVGTGEELKRFVFYDQAAKNYFQGGSEVRIKDYLASNGFKAIGPDTVAAVLSNNAGKSIVVFASNYFPSSVIQPAKNSLLRKYLDGGGRILILGANSLTYKLDDKMKQPVGFNVPFADSVLGLDYGPNDTRAFGGQFACFATEEGKSYVLPEFWTSMLFIKPEKVDVILGKNENGLASAFVKKYSKGGAFIQIVMHPKMPKNLDAIIKIAEAQF